MASLKEVKNRIISVKSTRQITSAMKMVASAKLHKAQGRIESLLPYQQKLQSILTQFMGTDTTFTSPYAEQRPVRKVAVVVCAGNASLCGAYNSNVAKRLEQTAGEYIPLVGREGLFIYPIGKKAEEATRKLGFEPQGSFQPLADKPAYADAQALSAQFMQSFIGQGIDRVELIYHHFCSVGHQELIRKVYLPIDLTSVCPSGSEANEGEHRFLNNYIVEPSVPELMNQLLPRVLSLQLFTMLLDASASEHAARMLAMQAATDNANDLIQDLTKQYNKSRQQAITNELLDIIGGSMR